MKIESVEEFLKRGKQITKCAYVPPEGILTANITDKPEPAFYEMDCDPNVVQTIRKPDTSLLSHEVDSDT